MLFHGDRAFMIFILFCIIEWSIEEELHPLLNLQKTKDSSQTLVRTKRKPAEDDYDYIEDFQKDEAEHSSPVRIQRDATENSTLTPTTNVNVDIDNVFNNIVDKSKPGSQNMKTYVNPSVNSKPTAGNITINPRNEIEKFFTDIATKNGKPNDKVRTGRETECNQTIETECNNDIDNIFNQIVEKSTVNKSTNDEEAEFEAIDNVFSNLVQKARHPSPHISKRNINKPKDNSANNFEKLRKMFEVMNKRSITEDEDNLEKEDGDRVSGDFESGSGRNEGPSGDIISGSGMLISSGQSEKIESRDEVELPSLNKRKRSLEEKNVKRYHRSPDEKVDLFDISSLEGKHKRKASKDGPIIRNPRSKILEEELKVFPDIPLPFIHDANNDLDSSGAAIDIFYGDDKGNPKKVRRRAPDLSLYPAFTKLIPFKEYKSLDIFKRALGEEKFNSLQIIDEEKAQHLFDATDGEFLKNIKKDGIYYDMQSKRFLISTEQLPRLPFPTDSKKGKQEIVEKKSQMYFNQTIDPHYVNKSENSLHDVTQKIISYQKKKQKTARQLPTMLKKTDKFVHLDTITKVPLNTSYFNSRKEIHGECDKPCDSLPTLTMAKRQILSDDDPHTDEIMGNDGVDLEEEEKNSKIKRAEKLYKFARNVIEVVANNTVIKNKRHTDESLLGVWSGLGTTPEFVHDLIKDDDYKTRPLRKQKRSKEYTEDIPLRNTKLPRTNINDIKVKENMKLRDNIHLQNGLVMMNGDNHHFYQANMLKPKVEIPNEIKRGIALSFNDNAAQKRKFKINTNGGGMGFPNVPMEDTTFPLGMLRKNKQDEIEHINERSNIQREKPEQISIVRHSSNEDFRPKQNEMENLGKKANTEQFDSTKKDINSLLKKSSLSKQNVAGSLVINSNIVQPPNTQNEIAGLSKQSHIDQPKPVQVVTESLVKHSNIVKIMPEQHESFSNQSSIAQSETGSFDQHSHLEQSESKQIEIGSLGSINMVPRVKPDIEKKDKVVKGKSTKKNKKMKRADQVPLNRKSAEPVQDGKVVLAFDEVKELLPTKHFFKDDFKDDDYTMDPNDERNSRSEIPVPRNYVDVDKELADSMMLAGDLESSPYKPDTRPNEEYEVTGTGNVGREKDESNNIISMFNGNKKLKHTQVKYHDDETKGKYNQMKHWLETDQASAYQKEADTARKIQEVIDKLAKSDAELHRLTSTMKNETTASLKPSSDTTVVGSADTMDEKDRDEKFKQLEQEIQEEHANYRKLVLQQQKQYEERLKAKAQLAKMQKEIDNLSLLHSTNSSTLIGKVDGYDSSNLQPSNKTDMGNTAFMSNSSMFTDLSNEAIQQNESNKETSETPSNASPTETSNPSTTTEAPKPPTTTKATSKPTDSSTTIPTTEATSTTAPTTSSTSSTSSTTTPTTSTATPTTSITTSTSAEVSPTVPSSVNTTAATTTTTAAAATTETATTTTAATAPAETTETAAATTTTTTATTAAAATTETATTRGSTTVLSKDASMLNISEAVPGGDSAFHSLLYDADNPFEASSHEVGYLNTNEFHLDNETLQAVPPPDDIASSGVIQYITKGTVPVTNQSTAATTESVTESIPPHSSFPFPLEIAYKPKIINPMSESSKKPEIENREDGYIGCYIDRLDQGRDLPVRAGIPLVTPHNCISACKTTGYKYAGLQYGYLCFCGNAYGKYDIVPDSECNTVCSGNDSFTCGGLWRNEIFETAQSHDSHKSPASPVTAGAEVQYDADDPLYVAKEKDQNNGVPTPITSPVGQLDIVQQRKSVIPTISDQVTDPPSADLGDDKVNAGQELLNEIHKYAISDLKALEDETQEAMSHSQSGIVRAIQNLTDDEILNKAKLQAAANPAFQKNVFSPPETTPDLSQQPSKDSDSKPKVVINYFHRPVAEEEEETKQSPELPVKIEPGTHLFRGEILLKQLWYDDLQNRDSVKFKILSGNIETAVKNIFATDRSFLKTEIMSLREAGRRVPHKTIADFSLTFYKNKTSDAVTEKIFSSVSSAARLDEMPVYPRTLKIKEYIMDPNARAYLPNTLHPVPNQVDTDSSERSAIPTNPDANDLKKTFEILSPSNNKSPPSNSARTHIKPVRVNEAQQKLRSYMSTQQDTIDLNNSLGVKQRSMIPKEPTIQKRNNNVPYVLRMFFWKDMLARRKRADKDGEKKESTQGKPRRSLQDTIDTKEFTINRERRAQADTWPTAYKKDSQKQTYNNNLTPHLLKRVKRVLSEPTDITDDIDTSKSFGHDLDTGYASLFDEPVNNNTVHSDSKTHKKTTLLGKMTDNYNNHDRIHTKTINDNTSRHDHMNLGETNSTDRFR